MRTHKDLSPFMVALIALILSQLACVGMVDEKVQAEFEATRLAESMPTLSPGQLETLMAGSLSLKGLANVEMGYTNQEICSGDDFDAELTIGPIRKEDGLARAELVIYAPYIFDTGCAINDSQENWFYAFGEYDPARLTVTFKECTGRKGNGTSVVQSAWEASKQQVMALLSGEVLCEGEPYQRITYRVTRFFAP